MSIASAITAAQGRVADAYTAISNKGGTLPATQNLTNMPTAINSIPSGGGSDTISSYQIVSGVLNRRTNTYNLTGTEFSNATSIDSYGLYYAFYGCTGITGSIDLSSVTSIGDYGLYYSFSNCTGITGSIDLSSVTSIGNYGLSYAFYGCTGITGSIDLSNVTSIESYGLSYAFNYCTGITNIDLSGVTSIRNRTLYYAFHYCTGITNIDLSNVTSIESYGLSYAFNYCTGITNIDLSDVTSIDSYGFRYAFNYCLKLQTINFNSIKTTSFNNVNVFNSMFNSTTGSEATGGCTVHFPSNLSSTIAGLQGYPTFGGSSSYINLAFDLPATS